MRKFIDLLKPRIVNVVITLIVLLIPFLRERVLLPDGSYVVEFYSPLVLIISYIRLLDFYPLFQMLMFSLLIYVVISMIIRLFTRIKKRA